VTDFVSLLAAPTDAALSTTLSGGIEAILTSAAWEFSPVPTHRAVYSDAWTDTSEAGAEAVTRAPRGVFRPDKATVAAPSFQRHYFYDKIYLRPAAVDLGAVASPATVGLVLWNAYPESSVNITGYSPEGDEGIVANLPWVFLPYEMLPLGVTSLAFDVSATEGPVLIEASYSFVFSSGDSRVFTITGQRAQLWAFGHNWADPLEETLSWKTALNVASNGEEHRASLRRNPRRAVSVSVFEQGRSLSHLDHLLFGWQHRSILVPLLQYKSPITSALTETDTEVFLVTEDAGFLPGCYVAFSDEDGRVARAARVNEVLSDRLTLTTEAGVTLPAGASVWPAAAGHASDRTGATWRLPGFALGQSVSFDLSPVETGQGADVIAAPDLYRGEEILLTAPDWKDGLDTSYEIDRFLFDGQAGATSYTDSWNTARVARPFRWLLSSRGEIQRFREFLQRRRGRAVSFWMPSHKADLHLSAQVDAVDLSIEVYDDVYSLFADGVPGRNHIEIRLTDGVTIRRRIVSSSPATEGRVALSLDDEAGVSFYPADVDRISYLSRYRLGTDDVTLQWWTMAVVVVEVPLVAVADNRPEDFSS
jgi:hypothetical protein